MSIASRFIYAAGVAGVVTVPPGAFVTGIRAAATGASAYCTIAAQGAETAAGSTGNQIPIVANAGYLDIAMPALIGNPNEIGDGSTLTFSGTAGYLVTMRQYGGG